MSIIDKENNKISLIKGMYNIKLCLLDRSLIFDSFDCRNIHLLASHIRIEKDLSGKSKSALTFGYLSILGIQIKDLTNNKTVIQTFNKNDDLEYRKLHLFNTIYYSFIENKDKNLKVIKIYD